MSKAVKKERYILLKKEIERHNTLYYTKDDPEISDAEYDVLYRELVSLEEEFPEFKEDSPTEKVGGSTKREMKKISHEKKLLSLENAFSMEELQKFQKKVLEAEPKREGEIFSIEQKIDGLSIALTYGGGKLIQAVTRGDGFIGEDVTENVRNIEDIPEKISFEGKLVIRGEVFMSFVDFEKVNSLQEERGEDLFKNPRNCAAGALRQLDPEVLKERRLSFLAFEILNREDFLDLSISEDRKEEISFLKKYIPTTEPMFFERVEDLEEQYLPFADSIKNKGGVYYLKTKVGNTIKEPLFVGAYPTDGLVLKARFAEVREVLGETNKYPRWAIAYKFAPEEQETVVNDIILQVGRTGRVTPVALVEPVEISGSMVSKASLHNQEYINALDLRIGDSVKIRKAGEIIPEIFSVCAEKPRGEKRFMIGDACPDCGSSLDKSQADYKCTNLSCPSKRLRSLIFFVSKECMDIQSLGDKGVKALIEGGYVKTIPDLYMLHEKEAELVEKRVLGAEKMTRKVLLEIKKSKEKPFGFVLKALGISGIGGRVSEILATRYAGMMDLYDANKEDLTSLEGIGEILADNLLEFFSNTENFLLLQDLAALGLQMEFEKVKEKSGSLFGKSFVITGTLSKPRSFFESLIKENGGEVKGSVSKKVDFLLVGEDAGSKLEKAKSLGISILEEKDLYAML